MRGHGAGFDVRGDHDSDDDIKVIMAVMVVVVIVMVMVVVVVPNGNQSGRMCTEADRCGCKAAPPRPCCASSAPELGPCPMACIACASVEAYRGCTCVDSE